MSNLIILILINTLSTINVYFGSYLGINEYFLKLIDESPNSTPNNPNLSTHNELTWIQALTFPISASFFLLALFFFFPYLQYIFVFFVSSSAWFSLYLLSFLLIRKFTEIGENYSSYIAFVVATLITFEWLRTGNIFLHDLLCCSLCTIFIATLRFPSLKIATLLLVLLFFYDAFWVFYSEYFFGKNVMVEVASKEADSPIYKVGEYIHSSTLQTYFQPHIELPIKLIFPSMVPGRYSILGAGDIVIPGALVALTKRFDQYYEKELNSKTSHDQDIENQPLLSTIQTNSTKVPTYFFIITIISYSFGLYLAFIMNHFTHLPQPALVYIVPSLLIAIFCYSYRIGRLTEVWSGSWKREATSSE